MPSQLQNLSDQFNRLLTQYTDTYEDYINVVSSNDTSLTTVPNSSFNGQSNISVTNTSSVNNCKTSCTSNTACSGATFNGTSNRCTLNKGTGTIIPSQQSTAIVQQAMYYSYQLQNLNSQLMTINQQMINISNSSYDKFKQTQQQTQQQGDALKNNYQTLEEERNQIDEMVRQFQTIDAAYENGNINVTSNYYSYIILLIVAIFLILVLLKFSISSEQRGGGNNLHFNSNTILIFCLLGFIIIFNSIIKK
jgi:hypothetical protein